MSDETMPSPMFKFRLECYGPDGKKKWEDNFHNTVVTAGKNNLLDRYFGTGAFTPVWFAGIKGTGSVAAADTMASHGGWGETTAYSGTNRPQLTFGAATGGTAVGTAVSFSMTGTYTAAGLFITSGTAVGGTVGTLYSAGDIAVARTGGSGDTLNMTPTLVIS